MLRWVLYARTEQTHLKRIKEVHQITHRCVSSALKYSQSAVFFIQRQTLEKQVPAPFMEDDLFPISVSPRHMTGGQIFTVGRRHCSVSQCWPLKIQTGLSELSLTTHTHTQTHIVQEIIINLVELEPIEQPITAERGWLSYSKHFYLVHRLPAGKPHYSRVILWKTISVLWLSTASLAIKIAIKTYWIWRGSTV